MVYSHCVTLQLRKHNLIFVTNGDLGDRKMNPGPYSCVPMTPVLLVAKKIVQAKCFLVNLILAFKCYLAYQKKNSVVQNHD